MGGGYDSNTIQTDILFCRLAYGFIPSEYIAFDFVDKKPDERRQFCSDLDTNVFGYTVNNIVEVQKILNKASSANKYQKLLKRDYLIISNKTEFESFHSFVSNHQVFVKKKVFSSMGKGVELIDIKDIANSEADYFEKLISSGTWLLEERVIQRKEMGCFNESSVNTVRCMTFKTRDGIVVPYCFMRTGRNGAFVDNGGSGGLLMGIDVTNGVVDTDALDEYGVKYETHPDSGIAFKGFVIPEWGELLAICKNAAEKEKDMGYLSWDMAYCDQGWVVIEVNEVGQFIGPQMVYQKGIKKELWQYLDHMVKCI